MVIPKPDFRSRVFSENFLEAAYVYNRSSIRNVDLPISTLRYYDKQGLFPEMTRVSGIRKFDDTEIDALSVIECLKRSGLEIKDIKQFMDWCMEGASTYPSARNCLSGSAGRWRRRWSA